MIADVFVSYRGADRQLARRLEHRLRSRWGSRVFRDETGLMPGRCWDTQLRDAMERARVMLAVIGPGWHVSTDPTEDDWVRKELTGAIKLGIPVLPVLFGDPDILSQQLSTLPKVFTHQAVRVSEDLAGFDLHRIVKGLRDLGAFTTDEPVGLGQQRSQMMPIKGIARGLEALHGKHSLLITGTSGSGRKALLRHLVDAEVANDVLVATHGLSDRERNRRTHKVIASWMDSLGLAILRLSAEEQRRIGSTLIKAVIDRGPDLLSRKVIRPSALLPIGEEHDDLVILDAARRPTERWTPFPPERLVSQSRAVIECFAAQVKRALTLVVDGFDLVDGSSQELVQSLITTPIKGCQLIIGSAADGPKDIELKSFTQVSLDDPKIWGESGAIISDWLARHRVRLETSISELFDQPNPYYALSSLWYLVDHGYLVENPKDDGSDKDGMVTWVQANPTEDLVIPCRERLLEHMVVEHIPIRFRAILEAGSLVGRTFPFSAVLAAADPPKSCDGEPPSALAIDRWRKNADILWDELRHVDPDSSVVVCKISFDGERTITLVQADLVPYFLQALTVATTNQYHVRLARYFDDPIAEDISDSPDDRFQRAENAASHWACAGCLREAADAHRTAAEMAEMGLAYREARRHYQFAIRILTQLIADNAGHSTANIDDHEDLLILANCLYRLGKMTRLSSTPNSQGMAIGPDTYFGLALNRLRDLSAQLHDRRLHAPGSVGRTTMSPRDIPQPNVIRHHIRLCEALSGYVNLELAEWHELQGNPTRARELLFDTLRYAEAARGEGGSRWLLAAASARLSQQLTEEAIRVQQKEPVRAHNLSIEAQFHIERVIGLRAVSPEEERDLGDPRSRAWRVLGQIFQFIYLEPQLAEWAFRCMNNHEEDVGDAVDMMTDRYLGDFLLSICKLNPDPSDANEMGAGRRMRQLLEQHRRWATESGIAEARAPVLLSLALLALIERIRVAEAKPIRIGQESAIELVKEAIAAGTTDDQRRYGYCLLGLACGLEAGNYQSIVEDNQVTEAFQKALDVPTSVSHEEILQSGWRAAACQILPVCPQLNSLLSPLLKRRFPTEFDEPCSEFGELLKRANLYVERTHRATVRMAGHDRVIWRLLEGRVPKECLMHADRTRENARYLLTIHGKHCAAVEGVEVDNLTRDVEYAIAVHDWYRSTDPARLLTLAREWNTPISGAEWASPNLLRGRLAILMLEHQYQAGSEIGRDRFQRIASMVENWILAPEETGPLNQLFFLASQRSEPEQAALVAHVDAIVPNWRRFVVEPGQLNTAYKAAREEHAQAVRQAGLPLVQDLHLRDVVSLSMPTVLKDIDRGQVPRSSPAMPNSCTDSADKEHESFKQAGR